MHGLRSLRESLQQDKDLTVQNVSIGYVGNDCKFTLVDGEGTRRWLDQLEPAAARAADAAMDVDPPAAV